VGDAVVAPFAAGAAAVSAHKRQLPGEKLAGCQERVGEALRESAEQQKFTERLMQAAAESGRRELMPLKDSRVAGRRVDTIFEPEIEQVRLERIGKADTSFALHVKARARLIDAATTNVIYDEPFEYLSGTALFVDWSLD
jgi:hypothetical protein